MNDEAPIYEVELPDGGVLHLQSELEVDKWDTLKRRYLEDYRFTKVNDLTTLGTLLQQQILVFRAQQRLSGMEQKFDDEGLPTGQWRRVEMSDAKITAAQTSLNSASEQVRRLEKALGIDKESREKSGPQNIAEYLTRLKGLARQYGVHISERVQWIEEFINELTWRLNLEQNGDAEDKAYHDCTPEGILRWAREQIEEMQRKDEEWGKEVGALYVGSL